MRRQALKKRISSILGLGLAFTLTACSVTGDKNASGDANKTAAETADVIYTNALFYTEDEENPEASAMAVKDDTIIYVGDDDTAELEQLKGENTQVIDLNGSFVTPSLIDAHTHIYTASKTHWHTALPKDVCTKEAILEYVAEYCEEHSVEEQPFIFFEYYPSDLFDENGPRKEWIDEVVSDRPILIEDFSDHGCWVNSKFLELLDMDQVEEDGTWAADFVKDEDGEYTGWILEFAWANYIENMYEAIGWRPDDGPTQEVMSYMTDDLKSWGVTGVEDGYIETEDELATLKKMDEEGKLNMNYDGMVNLSYYNSVEDAIDDIKYYNETYATDHIKVDTLKVFYDGTNELGDASLIDGWITDPDEHGYILTDTEGTYEMIKKCNDAGVDIHFHMVGDLAFRQVMDATEQLEDEVGDLDIQVEVCHCELIDPADYDRPAELGIIVNWTPQWSGGYFGDASLKYLGEERYNRMYQFNPIIDSGAIVTFGSDVYSMYEENRSNPYFGMQTAMTRIDIEYPLDTDGGMRQSEDAKLSLEDLLKGYTINAAIQLRIDDETGSLTVGKKASFNIYEENLFDVDESEFKDVMPTAVYFEGKCISGGLQ